MQKEIWKDVIGYEGFYQVSTLGIVKSLSRKVKNGNRFMFIKGRILKQYMDKCGYKIIDLSKNGLSKTMTVHKVMVLTFKNYDSNHRFVIDHIDNNKLNNNLNNLQIISQRQNTSKDQFRQNSSSKYIGVCWYKKLKKWRADIWINGKSKYIGSFEKESDAANAYQDKLKEITNTF